MQSVYENIISILTSPAGSLAYHLILVFAITWALQAAVSLWRTDRLVTARRLVIGLSLLLLSRLVLFVAGVFIATGLLAEVQYIFSLDRAVAAFGLVLIVWMWAFPEPLRLADAASILLSLLVVTLLALSLTWYDAQYAGIPYNSTPLNSLWEGLSLLISAAGLVFLLLRRPPSWEYGFGMLLILFAGHLVQLFWPLPEQSLPGAVRVAQLAAYPFLLALPQRYYSGVSIRDIGRMADRRPVGSAAVQILNRWFAIAEEESASDRYHLLAEFLTQLYDIETAAVLYPGKEASDAAWLVGYHRGAAAYSDPKVITESQIPILWNALQRGRPLRLHASSSSADLNELCQQLEIKNGNLLAVPVVGAQKELLAGLLLFSFDPSRAWSNDDQAEQLIFAQGIAQTMQPVARPIPETSSATEKQTTDWVVEPEDEQAREKLAAGAATVLLADLRAENEALRQELRGWQEGVPANDLLETELRDTLAEIARLQQQLSEADQKVLQAQKEASSEEHMEVVLSIVQELRQPMSSIVGYTDLLLGESVGILGALQRKFLERIKASSERMGALVEDLIQITSLDREQIALEPVEVDLNTVIDEAITHTSARFIEKNIALRVDIPDDLPQIQADQDALQQVVIHLLQNAGAASPVEGEIVLSVHNAQDELEDQDYVLLQVTDSGGGIPSEDLPRVFSRLYRADNPLIQGIGDTGVGLSVAKNLVEALNGRIWVDTDLGRGSTFSVLLPISSNGVVEEFGAEG